MTSFDKLLSFMNMYIPVEKWEEFLLTLDAFDTECRRSIIEHVRSLRD